MISVRRSFGGEGNSNRPLLQVFLDFKNDNYWSSEGADARRRALRLSGLQNAGYGIRTRELLRDRILSPAPLASLANPAVIKGNQADLACEINTFLKEKS